MSLHKITKPTIRQQISWGFVCLWFVVCGPFVALRVYRYNRALKRAQKAAQPRQNPRFFSMEYWEGMGWNTEWPPVIFWLLLMLAGLFMCFMVILGEMSPPS